MKCGDRKIIARVAAYPVGDYSRHVAHHQLVRGVESTIERNRRCGLEPVSMTIEDEIGLTRKKRPVCWLVARITSRKAA